MIVVVALLVLAAASVWAYLFAARTFSGRSDTEDVETQIASEYTHYTNLVLWSGYNTPYTEIDEIILSRYGIFCIEQKDHQGIIFGRKQDANWTQCMRNYRGKFMNPGRQNYKHRKALEQLLAGKLRANIHTYSYFPKAHNVITDDTMLFTSRDELLYAIRRHVKPVYTLDEMLAIKAVLDTEDLQKAVRSSMHITTLRHYLTTRQA